jgi:PAS domain S-box-containing protein
MDLSVRQHDALPELKSPTGGLEQQPALISFDLDRIMSDLPNGFATFDREWRYTYANNQLLEIFKLSHAEVIGKRAWEVFPHQVSVDFFDLLNHAMNDRVEAQFEYYYELVDLWVEHRVYPTADGLAILMTDISERKQAEKISQRAAKFDSFRLTLADALRPLADPVAIQATASRVLGEHLDANRVTYFEVRGANYFIAHDYANGATPLNGSYLMESFGSMLLTAFRNGRTVSISNIAADPNLSPAERAAFAAVEIGGYVGIPLVKGGEFVAGLALQTSAPRVWTADEIAIAQEVAERTWAALERARAEAVVAANLRDTRLLRDLGARLVTEDDTQTLYREILVAAIALTGADAGTVQILDDRSQDLLLIDSQGFDRQMTEYFYRVNASSHTSCGLALRHGERTFVDFDVPEAEDPDGSMRIHVEAGYLSAQSTPLISRTGKPLGMVSTHWRSRHRPIDSPKERLRQRELRSLDLLARQAADLIEQQQTTAALRESEERLRMASEAAKVGMWFWNLETDSLTWTQQCKAVFGVPAETEMSHAVFMAALHPDDRDRTQAAVDRSIAERTDYDIEYRSCWSDGSIHWIAAKGSCTYDPTGKPVRMMGVVLDITALKQAEAALRENEAQLAIELADTQQLQLISSQLIREDNINALYQQILDAAIALMRSDMGSVQMLDPDSNELKLLAWRGFAPASAEFWSVVRVDSDSTCGAALDSGERSIVPDIETCDFMTGTEDFDSYRLSGIRAVQSTPLISRHGRLVGMISTHWREPHQPSARRLRLLDVLARQVADLLDRKQVEIALRESEERLSLVQLAAKIGAWDWEIATGDVYWSPEYYTLYGIDPAAVTPNYVNWLASILETDRDIAAQAMSEALQQQQTYFNYEFRIAHPAQGIRWIGARGQIFYNPAGQPQRVAGIAIDVTDRQQIEIALAERNQELDSFVYIVSHDLKAPLRAISNLSEWIEEDLGTELPADTQQQMAQLRSRVQRMEAMITGLLEYARIGRTDAQIQLVSVTELLADILDSIAPPPTFEMAIAPELPTFHTKRLLLSQVFTNLISNAFKHHDKSGGCIQISCQERGNFYEFAVTDDGPGIVQEQRDRVFIIFQSANPQKNPDSTGIGLSIVKKIVETAGGHIWLESELGKGTTFYFTWPK